MDHLDRNVWPGVAPHDRDQVLGPAGDQIGLAQCVRSQPAIADIGSRLPVFAENVATHHGDHVWMEPRQRAVPRVYSDKVRMQYVDLLSSQKPPEAHDLRQRAPGTF